MVDLAIVIVNYNLKEYLRECLVSFQEYPLKNGSMEIIVVDNNSTDGSLEMLKEEFSGIRIISLPENRGFAAATNAGIRDSTGKYILLLNNDAKVLENTLDSITAFMNHYPEIGCVGCRHYGRSKKPQLTWGKFPSLLNEIQRKSIHFMLEWGSPFYRWWFNKKYSGAFEVDWVSGSCLAIRREVCERIGLLDENILIYFEDIDWCTKIIRAGWKVVHHGNIPVFHYGGLSAKKFSSLAHYQYRVSQLYFWNKYYPTQRVWFLRTLIFLRGISSFIRVFLGKLNLSQKPEAETQEQQFEYSKNTIMLGWSGKIQQ
ncbi:MAG: hypothetical protein A2161_05465 [Candidatus Schekmanbacteria bacterium RBG_13_48_7]|uniref:Glycosyltransferase 2-like domain-containing protein n=1 Tax=Candidatus Schekmanbacteria bacterium RBG_13_48_7 TaxID=1817878 RepID=A0A1F7S4P5_9BACT|nr:MAG: hypothetical protein A2161_05465 [Candidatus Schekmanbacteria bacterium RBG_13_48_7]